MILNVPPIDLFLEFEIGRSYHRLRGTLENPLYVSHGFGHIQAVRLAFKEAQLCDVEPDLWEWRVRKRKFQVKIDSFKFGGLNED